MLIVDLDPGDESMVDACAALLVEGFARDWPGAWADLAAGRDEVRECALDGWIARAALDEDGTVVGWIGGRPEYDGNVWELHPLVVRADRRGAGVGRALVADLERLAGQRGGLTLRVGSDDVTDMTSLGGVDLYPDPLAHLAAIEDRRGHPFGFYRRCGFALVGVVPDANGPGKPDILLAKRIGQPA
ncbi:MAG TPA: GNAT family N-acetyltransferase [Chloroflexota bacterium]